MHFDVKLFAFQLVNFLIFWAIVHFFFIRKLFPFMKERSRKIAEDIENARVAREAAESKASEWERRMDEVQAEADRVISEAKRDAEALRQQELDKTRQEVEKMVSRAREEIDRLRRETILALRGEVAEISGMLAMKFIDEKIDSDRARKLVEQIIESGGTRN